MTPFQCLNDFNMTKKKADNVKKKKLKNNPQKPHTLIDLKNTWRTIAQNHFNELQENLFPWK